MINHKRAIELLTKKRVQQLVVLVGVALVGTFMIVRSYAAVGEASLGLTPITGTASLGSTVTVTITENSSTVGVNAVQADLSYDQSKLQFVSIDTSTSAFSLIANSTGGNGKTSVASASTTPLTGSQTVAKVTFTAIGTGSTTVSLANTSGVARASDSVDIFDSAAATATYTISDTTAPATPTNLRSTGTTPTSVALAWNASTDNVGVTGYRIFRGGTQIATSATTSYAATSLAPSTNYSFAVVAYDAAGNASSQTAALAVTTAPDTTAPNAPTALTVGTRTLTSVAMSWTAPTDNVGVTGYRIYRGSTQIGTSTATNYTANSLTPGTAYSFTVAAVDAAGNVSLQSSAGSFSTLADTAAPAVPGGLTISSKTTTGATFTWTASTDNVDVTGYRIYRGGTQIATSATTSYTASGLTPGTAYSFTVAAYDAAGNVSAQSGALSVTTSTKAGDANSDNQVTYLDLSILASTWQSTTDLRADFNSDGIVNYLDLSVMAANWGK